MTAIRFDRPRLADVADLFAITSDARVWTHLPSGRHRDPAQATAQLERWIAGWDRDGLGTWLIRDEDGTLLGYGGCTVTADTFWNLGYRFRPEAQGRGLARTVAVAAIAAARELRPELPVVAYLLEHNVVSRAVAERVGLTLRHRAPDAGNPDPDAVRLVLADRALSAAELAATLA